MDEPVSMGKPSSIKVDGYGPIPVPVTIEEWMEPKLYPVQNINWYMSRQTYLQIHVPPEMINCFYYSDEHRRKFEQLLQSTRGSEYLNLVCNAAHFITDPNHQQWLMEVTHQASEAAAEFLISDLREHPDKADLMNLRNTIWQLIK